MSDAGHRFDPSILREYDIRGLTGKTLTAKDAHMTGHDFRHYYPRWEELEARRDPALCSRFWLRVTGS